MKSTATITITSGPERGQVFQLEEELTHLGKGADNDVELTDPLMSPRQLTILKKDGRFAICTSLDHVVEVDGKSIPPERWVWLPKIARVRVSDYTSFQFNSESNQSSVPVSANPLGSEASTQEKRRTKKKKGKTAKPPKKKQQIAQFITDEDGDSLVKLGEDGQLPELKLADSLQANPDGPNGKSGGSSTGLYLLLGVSVLFSCMMLLMDTSTNKSSLKEKHEAAGALRQFYVKQDEQPKLYQQYLQEARLARSRRERTKEKMYYRRILDLLNSEDISQFSGLTGSPQRDEELKDILGVLLQ